jgi:carbamoyltransferase
MILGLYHPHQGVGHDTAVALLDRHGRIVAAMSEERLSRVKMDGGFPFRALETILRITGVRPADLDAVAVPFWTRGQQVREGARLLAAGLTDPAMLAGQWATQRGHDRFQAGMRALGAYGYVQDFSARVRAVREHDRRPVVHDWRDFLEATGLRDVRLVQVDHHVAHASAAYGMSGFDDALVVTCDGLGALKSGMVAVGRAGRLRIIARTFYPNSAGGFWEAITTICGFHHMKHGGKITGLAAYGNPEAPCYAAVQRVLWPHGMSVRSRIDPVALARDLAGCSREDIAAVAQRRLIEVVVESVRTALRRTGRRKLALAGGVFANVRLNQVIAELPDVDEVFICPPMGDEGLGYGAAWSVAAAQYGATPQRQRDMYHGPEYSGP